MIICELHALNDVALDTAERFADRLGAHLDVERRPAARRSALPDQRISQAAPGAKARLRAINQLARNRAAAVDEAPLRRAPPAAPRGRGLDRMSEG